MDSLVQSLQAITEQLVEQLDCVTEEQISIFIDKREEIVQQLQQIEVKATDKKLYGATVRKVLEYDPIINAKLAQLRAEAVDNMQKVGVAKVQNTAYNNAYSADNSYYFDKKN